MSGSAGLLAALQYGDTFFPDGSLAFSGGLETLRNDGLIRGRAHVETFVLDQLRYRWATLDRPAMTASHASADDHDSLLRIDELVEAMSLTRESREGSRRAGAALLMVHEKLGSAGAAAYYREVRAGRAPGHLSPVQGLVWRGAGLDEATAAAVSAHRLCVGLLSAALRLGLIGHVESQRSLARLRGEIIDILAEPAPSLEDMWDYTPEAEVAAMRHETEDTRLFVT